MTGFYKDYADSSDTHQNSAEASADAAEVSANEAAASAAAAQDLEVTSASFNSNDGTLTLTKTNSDTVTTDLDGRYAELTGGASFSGGDFSVDADTLFIKRSTSRVGIRTNNPQSVLHVEGDVRVRSNSPSIKIEDTDAGATDYSINNVDGGFSIREQGLGQGTDIRIEIEDTGDVNINPYYNSGSFNVNGDSTFNGSLTVDNGLLYANDVNNRVGIGTTDPTHTLDVAGQIQSDDAIHIQGTGYARLEVGGGTGAYLDLKTPNSDDFDFRMIHDSAGSKFISPNADVKFDVGGSLRTIIKADGNVGIGTTSPNQLLSLNSTASTARGISIDQAGAERVKLLYTNSSGSFDINNTTAGYTSFSNNGSERMRINSSGNVVINATTANGTEKLSVNGTLATGGGTVSAPALAFRADLNTGIFRPASQSIGVSTNGTERMRIDASGNVGIGTNNPITPLQVNGTIYAEGGTFDPPDDGTPPSGSDTITNVAFAMPRDNKIGFWHDGYFRTLLHQDSQGVTQIGQLATSYITGIKLNCGASGSATIKNSNGNAGLTIEGSLTSSNITYPTTDGTNGQVIVTDGSGNLSFGDATANLSGKADLSGANFTGNVFVEKEYPTLNDLLTTSRTPEELANWGRYLSAAGVDAYDNADANYRDALDVNEDEYFSSADSYGIALFVAANYDSTDQDTFTNIYNGTNPDNSTFVTDVYNGLYNTGTFSTDITNNRVGINTVNPNATLDVNGNIAVSGTVDGVDIATLNSTVAGKADLSGATFTGNVVIGIPPSGTQSLTVAGATNLYDDLSLNNNDITNSGSISATQLTVGASGISSTGGITASTATVYGNVLQSGGNITCGNNLNVTGNITVGGTVDGRDVAADGTKLDSVKGTLTHNYWDGMQWSQGANRALTTTLTQYGDTQFVKHSGDTYKTYVDLSVDLLHNSTSGTNDAYCHLAVIAPLPSAESTINMGTCTLGTSGVSYIQQFTISGDWTEYFSPYIGISKNSDGSSPMSHPYKWSYNAYSNRTTVWVSLYTNAPSNGDTIYLHPFDWESSGTVINGEQLRLDGSSDTAVDNRRDFKIYLGRFDSRVGYRFLARENFSTDVVSLDTLRMSTTEYEA